MTAYHEALDANGLPETDEYGNAKLEPIIFKKVVCDESCNPRRLSDGSFMTEEVTSLSWGYRTSTGGIRASGIVFEQDFKLSCPMILNELPEGTILHLNDYSHAFVVKVQKCTTYNWGTNIWIVNPGNNGKLSQSE